MYQDMLNYVKHYLTTTNINASGLNKEFPFRDRFEHTLKVYEWAKRINEVEKGDNEIVEISAIFHDIGKGIVNSKPHAETGAEICQEYLKNTNFPENKISIITEAIRKHSLKNESSENLTLEQKILIDADSLDEVGALCVLWDAIDHGTSSKQSYYMVYNRIQNSFKKLETKTETLKTEEGKRLYKQRVAFLSTFLDELKYELGI